MSDDKLYLYLDDAKEQLEGLEQNIIRLEESPDDVDSDLINRIFRSIHTVKGGAGFIGLTQIRDLSHAMEDVLDKIRNNEQSPTLVCCNILLSSLDMLSNMLDSPEEETDISGQINALCRILVEDEENQAKVTLGIPDIPSMFSISQAKIDDYESKGFCLYIISFSSLHDGADETLSHDQIVKQLNKIGYLLDSKNNPDEGAVSESPQNDTTLYVLLTSVLSKSNVINYLGISPAQVHNHLFIEETIPQRVTTEETGVSETVVTETEVTETVVTETVAGETVAEDAVAEETDTENTVTEETVAEDIVAEKTVDENTVTENTVTENTVIDGIALEQVIPPEDQFDPSATDLNKASNEELDQEELQASGLSDPEAMQTDLTPPIDLDQETTPCEPNAVAPTSAETIVELIQDTQEPAEPLTPQPITPKVVTMEKDSALETSTDKKGNAVNSIRVSVDILDSLMNLAGELVLTRNQLNQNVSSWDQYAIGVAAQRLDSVTSELQASIMDTRMQPIGVVFSKFQRVVRDMSKNLGKQIKFEVEGEEVELDKTIIENIGDPLTHLVRNAIDHGLESPEDRRRIGKNPEGTMKLTAQHEAGYVLIKVQDDGAGLDIEKIKTKAIEKGLVDKSRLADMTDKEIIKFILEPGFSTASKVTDISGRGVGMDVVFTNISQLGGTIDIDSTKGKGSTFQVKLPLTLAIIPCLLVAANDERYALPQVSLVELVRIRPAQVPQRMERIGDAVVVRLRGNLLPIVRLRDFLGIDSAEVSEAAFDGSSSINIVVVAAGDFRYGIVVEELLDSEEIVVKPLGQHVRECEGYAGATILGDGCAALILDVVGIAHFMNLSAADLEKDRLLNNAQQHVGDEESLLIVENSPGEQFAIQLSYIHRIERIKQDQIQVVGNKTVIKYRGGSLRLYFLHEALEVQKIADQANLFLVVFPLDGVEVAIVASNIVDIIDIECVIDKETFKQPGVVGSAIISEQITLLLDVFGLVRSIGATRSAQQISIEPKVDDQHTVLVVEDSAFFREQIKNLLEPHDIKVILAEDGEIGLKTMRQQGDSIDLILSDIEMPNMNGLEMTEKIRTMSQFKDVPIIILSTVDRDDAMVKGHTAGVTDYLIKMDQDLVMETVEKYLNHTTGGVPYEQYEKCGGL